MVDVSLIKAVALEMQNHGCKSDSIPKWLLNCNTSKVAAFFIIRFYPVQSLLGDFKWPREKVLVVFWLSKPDQKGR